MEDEQPELTPLSIFVIGSEGCGKTTFVRDHEGGFQEWPRGTTDPVVIPCEADYMPVELTLREINANATDEELEGLHADVILACYSIVEPESFEHLFSKEDSSRGYLDQYKAKFPGIPIIVVGLKQDLETDAGTIEKLNSCVPPKYPVSWPNAKLRCSEKEIRTVLECSCATALGLSMVYIEAVRAAKRRWASQDARAAFEEGKLPEEEYLKIDASLHAPVPLSHVPLVPTKLADLEVGWKEIMEYMYTVLEDCAHAKLLESEGRENYSVVLEEVSNKWPEHLVFLDTPPSVSDMLEQVKYIRGCARTGTLERILLKLQSYIDHINNDPLLNSLDENWGISQINQVVMVRLVAYKNYIQNENRKFTYGC